MADAKEKLCERVARDADLDQSVHFEDILSPEVDILGSLRNGVGLVLSLNLTGPSASAEITAFPNERSR
jgi:hypothetical protein